MKRPLAFLLSWVFVLALAGSAPAAGFTLEPRILGQGEAGLVTAQVGGGKDKIGLRFLERSFALQPSPLGGYVGLVAVPAKTKPGLYTMRLMVDGKQAAAAKVQVKAVDYGTRRIKVDPKFMKLSDATLARYRREVKQIKAAYGLKSKQRLWKGGFIRPVDTVVVSRFGRRSIVNGQERSPHSGVDLRGKTGDPVRAPAAGTVALVLDSYFGGLMVVLDHGQGLVSSYLHLSKSLVEEGDMVEKGAVFCEVGKSGRVTGPHLHFSVILNKIKVEPLGFVELSHLWARQMGD